MGKSAGILRKYKYLIIFFLLLILAGAALASSCRGSSFLGQGEVSGEKIVSIGGRDLINMSSLTSSEKELYLRLSKEQGILTDKMLSSMAKERHWDEVVVKKGQPIGPLAARYRISKEELLRLNGIEENGIDRDTLLLVPLAKEYIEETSLGVREMKRLRKEFLKCKKIVSMTAYVVKEGDTIWSIAERFGLRADTVIGSNSPDKVNYPIPGTVLRIPDRDGIFVRINQRFSVERLAAMYGTKSDLIYDANNIRRGSQPYLGSELFIPGASYAAVIETGGGMLRVTSGREHMFRNLFIWPAKGNVSSRYGWRGSVFGSGADFHSGIDIAAPAGRAVVSAMEGEVIYAGWMGGYGKTLVIGHEDGFATLYGHCSQLAVKKGDRVSSGQLISYVGSTGRSTGSHLHFEIRKDNRPLDPLSLLEE